MHKADLVGTNGTSLEAILAGTSGNKEASLRWEANVMIRS